MDNYTVHLDEAALFDLQDAVDLFIELGEYE